MSNFTNNFNGYNSKKRPGDSKYLNSFLPVSNINDEKLFNKRQKLDPLVTVDGSGIAKNKPTLNSVEGTNCSSNCNFSENEVHHLEDDNIFRGFGIPNMRKSKLSKLSVVTSSEGLNKSEDNLGKSNSYLDDEESWFQGCIGEVVKTCTQIEEEVGIEVSLINCTIKKYKYISWW